MSVEIVQILYSESVRNSLDPGFGVLDNLSNSRPDWREYWPIRRALRERPTSGNLRGFFSPKYRAKTGLDAATTISFCRGLESEADVLTFSPFFDQSALFVNPFYQADGAHAGFLQPAEQVLSIVLPEYDIKALVMDSTTTIYCNYFVACDAFWSRWLAVCESIFAIAEDPGHPLAASLNQGTRHDGGETPMKVFLIERIATLLLHTEKHWRVRNLWLSDDTFGRPDLRPFAVDIYGCDAAKVAFNRTANARYFDVFIALRNRVVSSLAAGALIQ
jgi:hypothetical protein